MEDDLIAEKMWFLLIGVVSIKGRDVLVVWRWSSMVDFLMMMLSGLVVNGGFKSGLY